MANKFSYALSNPLSIILDKSPQDFRRSDLIKVIEKKNLERITFHYTALDGRLKELKLPVIGDLQAERILAEGERVDGSSLFKEMVDVTLSDLYVVPEYKTAFLNPFDQASLDFICRYLTKDGKRAPFALDNILDKARTLFDKNTGLELHALGELEFYLIGEREKGMFPLLKQKGYHESSPYVKSGDILNEMMRHLVQITGAVKYAHSENGTIDAIQSDQEEIRGKRAEQLEVEFMSKPVSEMADALVLGRWLIRNVAYKHGCTATFTPKLEEGVAGDGLHFHLELKRKGKNIMLGPDKKLSKPALRLIGGLCEHADSLTAFGNTVSSSYLRLVPGQEAPTRVFWSDLNRNAMIRVPLAWANMRNLAGVLNPDEKDGDKNSECAQTVELRTPDGSALIHLLLAGVVIAVEWGLQDNCSLELTKKLYAKEDDVSNKKLVKLYPPLPASCVESSRILLRKRNFYEREGIFPASVINYVVKILQAEDDEKIMKRLARLSGKNRLREIRRIMHKDLHKH